MRKKLLLLSLFVFALLLCPAARSQSVVTNTQFITVRFFDEFTGDLKEFSVPVWDFNPFTIGWHSSSDFSLLSYLWGTLNAFGVPVQGRFNDDGWVSDYFSPFPDGLFDVGADIDSIPSLQNYMRSRLRDIFDPDYGYFNYDKYFPGAVSMMLASYANLDSIATNVENIARNLATGAGGAMPPSVPAGYYPLIFTNAIVELSDNDMWVTNGHYVVTNYIQNGLFLDGDSLFHAMSDLYEGFYEHSSYAPLVNFLDVSKLNGASVPELLLVSANQDAFYFERMYDLNLNKFLPLLNACSNFLEQTFKNLDPLLSVVSNVSDSVSLAASIVSNEIHVTRDEIRTDLNDVIASLTSLEGYQLTISKRLFDYFGHVDFKAMSTNSMGQALLFQSLVHTVSNQLETIVSNIQSNNMFECCSNMYSLVEDCTNLLADISDNIRSQGDIDSATNALLGTIDWQLPWEMVNIQWTTSDPNSPLNGGWYPFFSPTQLWNGVSNENALSRHGNGFSQLLTYLDIVQGRQLATIGNLSYMILQKLDQMGSLTNIDVQALSDEFEDRFTELTTSRRQEMNSALENQSTRLATGFQTLGRLESSYRGYQRFVNSFGSGTLQNFVLQSPKYGGNSASDTYDILVVIEDWGNAISYLRLFMIAVWGFLLFRIVKACVINVLLFAEWFFFAVLSWCLPNKTPKQEDDGVFSRFVRLLGTVSFLD